MIQHLHICVRFRWSHYNFRGILLTNKLYGSQKKILLNKHFSFWVHIDENIGFPNGPVFRYGNFFIPRVEKSSKISTRAKNLVLPRAVGPREARFFSQGLIFEDFSTRGMKKFSYLKITAHSEIRFPHGPCGNLISFH